MLALTERSDEFYRGGIVINKYDKKIQLIPMKAAHIEDNNISALADKFSVHVAGKFNSDWGLAIIGEDITGQKLSRKSWLTIQYKNNIVLSTSVTQPRQGLRTPDVIVQKAIIHFLKSIVI
jgi:nicotinamide mononucleotide (NMN) deamidase PncC